LLAQEAIGLLESTGGYYDDLLACHSFLGKLYAERGDHDKLEMHIRKQIQVAEQLYHPAHVMVASAIQSLAHFQVKHGRLGDGRKTMRDLRKRLELSNRPVSDHLRSFASALKQTGRYEDAEEYLREALWVITASDSDPVYASPDSISTNPIVGSLHENQMNKILDELASTLIQQDKVVEAETLLDKHLEPRKKLRASDPVSRAFVGRGMLRPYVSVLVAQGKNETAKTILRRELAVREETLGANHPRVVESLQYQGTVLRELGDLRQSEAALRRSLQLHRVGLPRDHWYLSKPLSNLAQTLTARGKFSEAEDLLLQSYNLLEEQIRHSESRGITCLRQLIDLYQKWNRPDDAAKYRAQLDSSMDVPKEM
jgi:tetratricopeptide (TPR) repeat protein